MLLQFIQTHQEGKRPVAEPQAGASRIGHITELSLTERMRHPAHESGLPGPRVADHDQPLVTQRFVERQSPAFVRGRFEVHFRVLVRPFAPVFGRWPRCNRRLRRGEGNVELVNGKPMGPLLPDLQAADVDVFSPRKEITQIGGGIGRMLFAVRGPERRQQIQKLTKMVLNLFGETILRSPDSLVGRIKP